MDKKATCTLARLQKLSIQQNISLYFPLLDAVSLQKKSPLSGALTFWSCYCRRPLAEMPRLIYNCRLKYPAPLRGCT
jgi:hypothetical protein